MRRIVPNIYSDDTEKSKLFYTQFLGMELAMDLGLNFRIKRKQNRTDINFPK